MGQQGTATGDRSKLLLSTSLHREGRTAHLLEPTYTTRDINIFGSGEGVALTQNKRASTTESRQEDWQRPAEKQRLRLGVCGSSTSNPENLPTAATSLRRGASDRQVTSDLQPCAVLRGRGIDPQPTVASTVRCRRRKVVPIARRRVVTLLRHGAQHVWPRHVGVRRTSQQHAVEPGQVGGVPRRHRLRGDDGERAVRDREHVHKHGHDGGVAQRFGGQCRERDDKRCTPDRALAITRTTKQSQKGRRASRHAERRQVVATVGTYPRQSWSIDSRYRLAQRLPGRNLGRE